MTMARAWSVLRGAAYMFHSSSTDKILKRSVLKLRARRRLSDLELLFVHLGINVRKERRGQVPFSGVRDHGQHHRAFWRLFADLQSGGHGCTTRCSTEDAFHPRKFL